jgi:hypothetical protein
MYCRVLNSRCVLPPSSGPWWWTHLWNVGRHSIKNTAVHPRRFWASYSPPWEFEISHVNYMLAFWRPELLLVGLYTWYTSAGQTPACRINTLLGNTLNNPRVSCTDGYLYPVSTSKCKSSNKVINILNIKKRKIKIIQTLALPTLLYGSEIWTIKQCDKNRLRTAEMKYFRQTEGYTLLNHKINEEIL